MQMTGKILAMIATRTRAAEHRRYSTCARRRWSGTTVTRHCCCALWLLLSTLNWCGNRADAFVGQALAAAYFGYPQAAAVKQSKSRCFISGVATSRWCSMAAKGFGGLGSGAKGKGKRRSRGFGSRSGSGSSSTKGGSSSKNTVGGSRGGVEERPIVANLAGTLQMPDKRLQSYEYGQAIIAAQALAGLLRPRVCQEDLMQRTEEDIRRSIDKLRNSQPKVREALELKKRLAIWQSQTARLNVIQFAKLPSRQVEDMKAVEAQLRKLQEDHNISDRLLHNIAQEATWDASARVKDQRQANVQLPPFAVEHMQAVVSQSQAGPESRVMDVGAGTGILLRFLQEAGVQQENFVGVDLSTAMVDVARERYPRATFIQRDFLDYSDDSGSGFTHVFFNGCLHNFLEPGEALSRAAGLLTEGGRIVISHPKGAANVDMQRRANPMLVPNRLPTRQDLERAYERIPALAAAAICVVQDNRAGEGYLEVLQRNK